MTVPFIHSVREFEPTSWDCCQCMVRTDIKTSLCSGCGHKRCTSSCIRNGANEYWFVDCKGRIPRYWMCGAAGCHEVQSTAKIFYDEVDTGCKCGGSLMGAIYDQSGRLIYPEDGWRQKTYRLDVPDEVDEARKVLRAWTAGFTSLWTRRCDRVMAEKALKLLGIVKDNIAELESCKYE